MLTHNTYFEGKVQSVGFERNGRKATVADDTIVRDVSVRHEQSA